jgi:putative protein kinase ArgK-like GTPase of G3E family
MVRACDFATIDHVNEEIDALAPGAKIAMAKLISYAEQNGQRPGNEAAHVAQRIKERAKKTKSPVVGITGTGGAGKSSLCDEILRRYLADFPESNVAVLSIDPTKKKTGGALLGDRIRRMNALNSQRVYMRGSSLATRESGTEVSEALDEAIEIAKAAGYELILVETSGIGQGNSKITELVDISVYVMTSEFGAPSQLEKIDMLDLADMVAINKFDAARLRSMRCATSASQMWRNRNAKKDLLDPAGGACPSSARSPAHFNGSRASMRSMQHLVGAHRARSDRPRTGQEPLLHASARDARRDTRLKGDRPRPVACAI